MCATLVGEREGLLLSRSQLLVLFQLLVLRMHTHVPNLLVLRGFE